MIIVRLMGGLGNQMFQYAAARRLACFRKTDLKLDVSFLEGAQQGCTPRTYELKHLSINAAIASANEIADLTRYEPNRFETFLSKIRRIAGLNRSVPTILRELHFHFDPSILDAPDNSYLEGYWQSEKYFTDISDILRSEFTVRNPLSNMNLLLANEMQTVNSVSMHIRRGDYVHDESTAINHGVCGLDYYRRCVDQIIKKVAAPHFYIFSDEPEWAQENINLPYPTKFVTNNSIDKGYEDLRLMSLCRHNIIANSSLSWWGAWLNRNLSKQVYYPARWFNQFIANTDDLTPEPWIKI